MVLGAAAGGKNPPASIFLKFSTLSQLLVQRPVGFIKLNPHLETPWFMDQGPHPHDYPRMAFLPVIPRPYISKFQVIPWGQGFRALYLGADGAEIKQ